jgi:RHS repeat-associated protein
MNSVYRLLAECRLLAHGRGRRGRQRRHRLRPPQRAAAGLGRDPFGRVVEQRWTSSVGVTDDFVYGYDRNGNALYRANLLNHNFDELYHASGAGQGYDNFNEIVAFARGVLSASVPGGPLDTVANPTTLESWRLNAVGGMSSVTVNGATQNRSYNAQNQATTVGNATLTYDKAGNVTADQTGQQLVYDAWGRLVKVLSASGAVLAAYAYDGLGRRIQETASGITTDLYYDQQGNVLEEDVGGVAKAQYVYSPADGSLIERDRDATGNGQLSERLYAQTDANGDVTALVNAAGQVVERYVYDPYGTVTVLDANWNQRAGSQYAWRYLFQGGRYDSATGYYHFGARDYSPGLGSWLEQDPLGLGAGSSNLYQFAEGNPTNRTDPSGLISPVPRRFQSSGVTWTSIPNGYRSSTGIVMIWDPSHHGIPHFDVRGPGIVDNQGRPAHVRVTVGGRALTRRDQTMLHNAGIEVEVTRSGQRGGGGRGGLGRRGGNIHPDTLTILGASAIGMTLATYGYQLYQSEGERIGTELATRVGLGRRLQLLGAAGMLPNGLSFDIQRNGDPTIHVLMVQQGGQWYFTAWHYETAHVFLFFGAYQETIWDIRLGDVPAYHIPRSRTPADGPWPVMPVLPEALEAQLDAVLQGRDPGPPAVPGPGARVPAGVSGGRGCGCWVLTSGGWIWVPN